jgi:polysaccharide export outer membrane protein
MRLFRFRGLVMAPVLLALALSACAKRPAPVVVSELDTAAYRAPAVAYVGEPVPVAQIPDTAYRLDAGDRLRIVVYGQDGLTNTYSVDAAGSITMPLIGAVRARGLTTAELARAVAARLRQGFIREPFVAAEVEQYRPFFILGEVAAPGQYPYVPNMTIEAAIAIASGFSPRASRGSVVLSRNTPGGPMRVTVPVGTPLSPGDTVTVKERWF